MKGLNEVMLLRNLGKNPKIQELERGYTLANHFIVLTSPTSKSEALDKANINETLSYKRKELRLYGC